MKKHHVIGVDFGSDSVRALIVDAEDGREISEAIAGYPRWLAGKYQDAGRAMFRQHPLDYIESLTTCVREALKKAGEAIRMDIAALSVDTTGSTPCPVNRDGVPLALLPGFEEDPDAMFHLWKDHTAIEEAATITRVFQNNRDGIDYTQFQGEYASEWFWAKILHSVRVNPLIKQAAYSWVEHSDWMCSVLVGRTKPEEMYRCECAAGHKAYWNDAWGGLPSSECLKEIDPYLLQVRSTYGEAPKPSTYCLGRIAAKWAKQLGLEEDVLIGGSSFDAHAGAVGAGINPETMIVNLGTSAVDMFVVSQSKIPNKSIAWAGGMAKGSIIPGLMGVESAQAAFGDVYAWFRELLMWPLRNMLNESDVLRDSGQREALIEEMEEKILNALQKEADRISPKDAPIALDWFNGRRYPHINETVSGAICGLKLGMNAPMIYRSLITATAFGQKRIIESLEREGIAAEKIVAIGGIAQKSPLLMQTLADVLGKPVSVSKTRQACALGASMYAAVAAEIYHDLYEAQSHMRARFQKTYQPDMRMKAQYETIYREYLHLSGFIDPMMIETGIEC